MHGLLNHRDCEIFSVCCLKPLNLWRFVTELWQTNTLPITITSNYYYWLLAQNTIMILTGILISERTGKRNQMSRLFLSVLRLLLWLRDYLEECYLVSKYLGTYPENMLLVLPICSHYISIPPLLTFVL